MKVLVTGGAGYIGSHACKALARAGYTPVTYDNLSRGHLEAVRFGPFEQGHLADVARVREVIRLHQPLAVLHFAAFMAAGESVTNPELYYRNNVAGSLGLIEALREEGIDKLVFSSTAAVYGTAAVQPIREDAPKAPENPYGFTKFVVEQMLADERRAHGLMSVSLRYFNATGADPDGELGECHEPETHLIPLVLEAAAGKREALHLYGNDYPTKDGTCIRDYIHVSDLARAHVLALQRLLAGQPVPAAMNLGTGQGHSVAEVIAAAEKVTGRRVPVILKGRRPGDPPELVADSTLARRELGFVPEYPELARMIDHGWRWQNRP